VRLEKPVISATRLGPCIPRIEFVQRRVRAYFSECLLTMGRAEKAA